MTKKETTRSLGQVHRKLSGGAVHKIPGDLRKIFASDQKAREAWEDITPLARNEWICWIESVKKSETRNNHIERTCAELKAGKRRPCCWAGCNHRWSGWLIKFIF